MVTYDAKRIQSIGRILVLASIMIWFYRQDLMSLNVIIVLNFIMKFIINLVAKTSLFTKKEADVSIVSFKRKAKIFSLLISIFMAVIILSATAFLTMSDQVGGDVGAYDSPNYYDGKFNNVRPTDVLKRMIRRSFSIQSLVRTILIHLSSDQHRLIMSTSTRSINCQISITSSSLMTTTIISI